MIHANNFLKYNTKKIWSHEPKNKEQVTILNQICVNIYTVKNNW